MVPPDRCCWEKNDAHPGKQTAGKAGRGESWWVWGALIAGADRLRARGGMSGPVGAAHTGGQSRPSEMQGEEVGLFSSLKDTEL